MLFCLLISVDDLILVVNHGYCYCSSFTLVSNYMQAMNFFAGLLLLLMPEENAFW